ncbi:CGI-141 protein homolog, putative [Plasmodium berghei]|uniref:Protein transport protein GOT1, putative n=2 Tax=Plasmodium berghei TaxID=5821 RepID=A0A509AN40_PLABA|nr:protein transport protein GOT1, putative [Plasmodium berghei ANKA]CXI27252.1 CGI-141 protein homolog, putative [Plasmodium berghei]SCM20566.1 CGI-141 protein homolog, putative [Plasmodium berghei]SCN24153.1 CGI-141 protein homolog, putative [Plasmodium berghei]SCO59421.1 CGI-141 protein homolog, putative [Plasmodium berghei]SCO60653.1 CGI-141 protein homolog, putative [Plasmodium berghei]|eukprot:XP_034420957.1 protein transport protein GOT1, putative [Plasmodium berghei ANKA]
MLNENKTIGLVLFFLGIVAGFIGVFLFFDKFFLCISNLFFLLGLYYLLGLAKIIKFVANRKKIAGSACFLLGFFLIVLGRTFFGVLFQGYGLYKLFFSFLPNIVNTVKYSPLSFILEIPGIKQISEYLLNNKRLPI